MTVAEDWKLKAAEAIDGNPEYAKEIRGVIDDICPFKDDVAYMPVPRCETCKKWEQRLPDDPKLGNCGALGDKMWISTTDEFPAFCTQFDFGCVQWEKKE